MSAPRTACTSALVLTGTLAGLVLLGTGGVPRAIADTDGWLITPEEAAQPPAPPGARELPHSGPLDIGREPPDIGPIIEVLRPTEGTAPVPPIEIVIRFTPRQQPVDLKSLKVSVVKLISIDITDRVRPYVTDRGIQIPDAKLPSGEHTVRISLSDVTGAASVRQATMKIP